MIDHVLGRPSVQFRKIQVFAVVLFWSSYLLKGNRDGPPGLRRLSTWFSKRLSAWQSLVVTLLWLYVCRNFGKLVGLECPEPLANLYNRSYFRATWITTALDAGFWSAMHIRKRWARNIFSMICTIYYLICAEQADEKVRKIRSIITVDHLRVSWNKPNTTYIAFFNKLMRPRFMRYQPRAIRIPRPNTSSYTEPVHAWLYFDGPISALKKQRRVILNIPGGGFVAMNPRTHDDSLLAWAGKTGLPVLSLDYRKAPEFPYPYALNECYDVYQTIIATRGRCVGFSGEALPQVVVSGDSAGGNLATAMVLMVVQSGSTDTRRWNGQDFLPPPVGLVLTYPALDMNIGNWMTDEQMALIRDRKMRRTNQRILRHKSNDYRKLTPSTPLPSDDEGDSPSPPQESKKKADKTSLTTTKESSAKSQSSKPQPLRTRLATPSLISYVNDRILTPEMMRAMIILYIGPHYRPDFSTEYLLSPVLAPDALLAEFPKTYILTGERDPLVDDTVIFAGRIRQAKAQQFAERKELGLVGSRVQFNERDHVNVELIEGISHGFLQFVSVFPEGWSYISRCAEWYEDAFACADARAERKIASSTKNEPLASSSEASDYFNLLHHGNGRHHRRTLTGSSGDDDRPLEIGYARPSPMGHGKPHANGDTEGNYHHSQRRSNNDSKSPADGLAREHPLMTAASTWSLPQTPATTSDRQPRRQRSGLSSGGKSLVSLASEDDLLGRRMKGLTGALTGEGLDIEEDD